MANASGTILATGANSHVDFASTSITGGLLETSGGGEIRATDGGDTLTGVTITSGSLVEVLNNDVVTAAGTITDDGTLSLAATGNGTELSIRSSVVTLTGGGLVQLSDNAQNFIEGTGTLDSASVTIQGAGDIGNQSSAGFEMANAGTIDAQYADLALSVSFGGGTLTNTGLLETTSTGGLDVTGTVIENASGVVLATGAGSLVELASADIIGGQLQSTLGGALQAVDGGTVLDNVTLTSGSVVEVANNDAITLADTITNQGTFELNSSGNSTELRLNSAAVTLTGGGLVQLTDNAQTFILGTGVLDNTIQGGGDIGNESSAGFAMTNAGTIDADAPRNALSISFGGGTLTNTGLLEATATQAGNGGLVIVGTTIADASIAGASTGTILAAGANSHVGLASATILGGSLETSGGGVLQAIDGGTVLDGVTLTAGSTLDVLNNDAVTATGTITDEGVVGLVSSGNGTELRVAASMTVTLTGGGTVQLSDNAQNDIVGDGGSILDNLDTIQGSGDIGNQSNAGLGLTNAGTIDATGTADGLSISLGTARFANAGVLEGAGAGGLSLVSGTLSNTGLLWANGGSVAMLGEVLDGTGSGRISGNGLLELTVDTSTPGAEFQSIAFDASATGTLRLDNSQAFQGSISGFSANGANRLDLSDISATTAHATYRGTTSGGTLTVTDGTHLTSLVLVGDYTAATPMVATDGHGGTIVTFSSPPCYVRGTRILTDRGETAVEDLAVGDLAVTVLGRGPLPVRWLGHRRLDLARHPRPEQARPIRIQAGALGKDIPHRDLLVSPGHRMLMDGGLVCACDLVNGATITQESPDHVEYWHVELDGHDVLLAEGAQAESYQDTGNRAAFENAAVTVLHAVLDGTGGAPCRPHAEPTPELRERLALCAEALGWRREQDARPWLEVDGACIEPVRRKDRCRFELPPGATEVRLRSRSGRPCDVSASARDPRRLGLFVHRLALRGPDGWRDVPLDHPLLSHGFHTLEQEAQGWQLRWTDGDVRLPLGSLAQGRPVTGLEVEVDQCMLFWVAPILAPDEQAHRAA